MLEDAIAEFWTWWETVADPLADAIDTETATDIPDELSERIWAIHPELDWQIITGAPHRLNLVSAGSRTLRLIAAAWAEAAPRSSRWTHAPARLPFHPEPFLVRGSEVDADDARFALEPDPDYQRVDVTLAHPAFDGLGDDEAREVAMYLLDAALGEDGAERWVGVVTTGSEGGDLGFDDLTASVEAAVAGWEGPSWVDVSDQYDGVVVARVDRAAKWIDHLDKPTYAEITMQSLANDTDGQPEPLEARRLDTLTDDLVGRLGSAAVLVGEATGDGERTLHLFVQDTPRIGDIIDNWVAEHSNRHIDHEVMNDPQWGYAEQWD